MPAIDILTSEELSRLATTEEYVDAVREGYRERGNGAHAEPRTRLDAFDPRGFLTGYFAILPETGAMGGYMYTAGFESRDAHFVLPLFDANTGEHLALLDGASLNPFKTAAAGAVGVDVLAREDATDVGVIGSAAQARGQVLATATVRDLDSVAVYSRTPENRDSFATEMGDRLDATVKSVESSEAAVSDADIVITSTNATKPVFDGENLSPGTHITAMGQYHSVKREIDVTTIARSKYVVDLEGRLEQDAGAYMAALEEGAIEEGHVHGELGDVVAGNILGRESEEEITMFDSGGTGIETVAAAKLLYDRATAEDIGTSIDFSPASEAFIGR